MDRIKDIAESGASMVVGALRIAGVMVATASLCVPVIIGPHVLEVHNDGPRPVDVTLEAGPSATFHLAPGEVGTVRLPSRRSSRLDVRTRAVTASRCAYLSGLPEYVVVQVGDSITCRADRLAYFGL